MSVLLKTSFFSGILLVTLRKRTSEKWALNPNDSSVMECFYLRSAMY